MLQLWMRLMGAMYVVAATVAFIAPDQMIDLLFLGVSTLDGAYPALGTVLSVWGAYVGVIGAAVLIGSRAPLRHSGLVGLVIGLESVATVGDIWLATLDHVNRAIVAPPIVLHAALATAGALLWRRAKRTAEADS